MCLNVCQTNKQLTKLVIMYTTFYGGIKRKSNCDLTAITRIAKHFALLFWPDKNSGLRLFWLWLSDKLTDGQLDGHTEW